MYKAKLIKDGTIFLGKTKKELADKLETTPAMIDRWLNGQNSANYKEVKKLTEEEYEKELNIQRKLHLIKTITQLIPKENNNVIFQVCNELKRKRFQILREIKEKYANKPETMKTILFLEKKKLEECTSKYFPRHKFIWNEINNNYKRILI